MELLGSLASDRRHHRMARPDADHDELWALFESPAWYALERRSTGRLTSMSVVRIDFRLASPSARRRPLAGRPQLAVWVVPNVEHYELLPSAAGVREPWPRTAPPDGLDYPRKDYGNRVGLDRCLDVCDRLGIRCTVSLSLAVPVHVSGSFAQMQARAAGTTCATASTTRTISGTASRVAGARVHRRLPAPDARGHGQAHPRLVLARLLAHGEHGRTSSPRPASITTATSTTTTSRFPCARAPAR